jgi:superfamily II DNA/RNA helicase
VSSHTGSGKTAAFLLPSLHKLAEPSQIPGAEKVQGPRLLVLCPTRELALQVQKQAGIYGAGIKKLRTVCLVGGAPFGPQFQAMRYNPEVMIATPGRLIDHMSAAASTSRAWRRWCSTRPTACSTWASSRTSSTSSRRTPATRQTMLFSATLDGVVGKIAAQMTKSPKPHRSGDQGRAQGQHRPAPVVHRRRLHKHRLLDVLLRDVDLTQAVVFTATKKAPRTSSETAAGKGFAAAALHGDMPQHKRNRTLQRLRDGRTRMLVATDVAARGIDVAGISHVINFDAPRQAEDYVHRIGRTGRAGRTGIAVTLVHGRERGLIRDIERYTGQTVRVDVIAGMEPRPFGKPGGKKFGHKPGGGKTWGDKKPWGEPKPWGDRKWEDKPRGAYQGQGTDRPRAEDSRGGGYAGNGGSWQGKPESRPAWKDGNTGGEARPARSNTWDRGEKNGNTWGKPEVRRADVNGNSVSYKPESRPANPHGRTWGEDARPHGGAKPRGRQSW